MQRYAVRLSAALVAFLVGTASSSLWNGFGPARGTEREVREVEREYVSAHLERDVAALERLLADDFSSFRGRVRKEHRLAMLANPHFKIVALTTKDVEVSVSALSYRGREVMCIVAHDITERKLSESRLAEASR